MTTNDDTSNSPQVSSTADTPPFEVTILSADRVKAAATVMATAFVDSPAYVYMFRGDKGYREAALLWLFERNITAMLRKAPIALRGIVVDDQVVAAFMVVPSTAKLSMWEMVVAGLAWTPFKFGFATFKRIMTTVNWYDEFFEKFIPPERSSSFSGRVTLERMTVLPSWQGKGLGTCCVASCLQEAREKNLQVVLATQEERNVRFYSQREDAKIHVMGELDFEVLGDDNQEYAYHSWCLCYSPPVKS